MTDATVVHQDAFILLFIFILVWILYSFDYPIVDKLSDENVKKYLAKIPFFNDEGDRQRAASAANGELVLDSDADYAERSYDSLTMLMRRLGFALLLLFCLPAETVHMFKSNAQYYWSILAFSLAIYQCVKLLVFEQLEQFEGNRLIARLMRSGKAQGRFEKEIVTLAIGVSLLWIVLILIW